MNGVPLTLGLVGALAAAGVLGRRGSRDAESRATPFRDAAGSPRVLYHQTRPQVRTQIQRQGFRTDKVKNRGSDREMPDGVFLKPSAEALGMGGSQISVVVTATHPLVVSDRDALVRWVEHRNPEYARLRAEAEQVDADNASAFDRAFRQQSPYPRGTPEHREFYDKKSARMHQIVDPWGPLSDSYSARLRALVTQTLRDAGHDSLWMKRDEGTRGRTVETIVVLDPREVKVWTPSPSSQAKS